MGSHLVEKELVKQTVPELAKVVNTALFNTTVDTESGDLTINGNVGQDLPTLSDNQDIVDMDTVDNKPTISEVLDDPSEILNKSTNLPTTTYFVVVLFGSGVIAGVVLSAIKSKPKRKSRKK